MAISLLIFMVHHRQCPLGLLPSLEVRISISAMLDFVVNKRTIIIQTSIITILSSTNKMPCGTSPCFLAEHLCCWSSWSLKQNQIKVGLVDCHVPVLLSLSFTMRNVFLKGSSLGVKGAEEKQMYDMGPLISIFT